MHDARALAEGQAGQIALGFVGAALASGILPSVLRRLRSDRPNVRVVLRHLSSSAQLAELRAGEIDLALIHGAPRAPELAVRSVLEQPYVLAVARPGPLVKGAIRAAQLDGQPWIVVAPADDDRDRWAPAWGAAGFTPRVVVRVVEWASALALVDAGIGLTLLPRSYAAAPPRRVAIRELPWLKRRDRAAAPAAAACPARSRQRTAGPLPGDRAPAGVGRDRNREGGREARPAADLLRRRAPPRRGLPAELCAGPGGSGTGRAEIDAAVGREGARVARDAAAVRAAVSALTNARGRSAFHGCGIRSDVMSEHVFLERSDLTASLSSWITTAMSDLYVAEQKGLRGYIRWTRERSPSAYQDHDEFSRRSNMWEWYFRQPHCDAIEDSSPIWVWEETQQARDKYDINQNFIERFYKERLRFNAEVEAEAEELAKKYSVDFSKTLGVAWRGTDKHTEAATTPIARYFPAIDQLIREVPDLRIFTKPEEKGALTAILERYPQAFSMPEFFSAEAGERLMMDRVNPVRGYERGKQVALLILFYSRCKYLFKNAANMSDVAGYLSRGEVRHIP